MKLGPSVFAEDMNKPQNVACRPPKMVSFIKTHGDPAVIKKGGCGAIKGKNCGAPSQMDAEELMAIEEDMNDEEQQQDAKKIAIYLSGDLKEQMFTDVTVTSKDHVYKIHKEYLLAFTNYDIPVKEGEPLRDAPSLNLCEIDGADVAAVLHFLYYGELKANIHNILGIMAAAHAMDLVDVPAVIQEYHDKLFAPPNQTNIIDYAVCKGMECLEAYTWKVFVSCFSEHANGCHFLNWDVRWVVNLLCHDDIPILTELEVFEAARLWINYRLEERTDHVRTVLSCVRWVYMTAEEMVCCEREDPCLMNRPEAHELIADANFYKVMIQKGKSWREFNIKPPRGAYAGNHPVEIPKVPTGKCGDRATSTNSGKCGPKVAMACQTNCQRPAEDSKKFKCPPGKEKDHCGSGKKKEDKKDGGCGKEDALQQQLRLLPIPPESDLFSTMSYLVAVYVGKIR
ncbi:kelch-like protein 3 [Paramacrobiotus metropolitanus]|uniref:kelch-like protein 3 n=1 Tax=Paramacrobiotus metropolitanus TaxID=2943436 RepID=UPI0024462CCE|nr:kelch-like protein 3 [Paramacrobiotus metropolitanus]